MVNGMTPRYCAPEVAEHNPRNTSSDIWSLGAVFLEMVVVLKGKTASDINIYFEENGSKDSFIRANPVALEGFITLDIGTCPRARWSYRGGTLHIISMQWTSWYTEHQQSFLSSQDLACATSTHAQIYPIYP